ncbi:MAG: phosphoribosylformylglycinamidine synthase subunit PurS [Actinomycetia bacterium]|nr:phosphoribosylformylglycinamidine synthase subunit PurS [Actinomycetes bacterium]
MRRFQIHVTGKQGIFDPAGEAAENALANLGYAGLQSLRIGKYIELECSDDISSGQVKEMCERLLANPVIEDFRIDEVV